ncbi:Clumping factor ClfB, fibrinogen binding protein [Staphylococcus aureus]|nr:Clumping factor ClfB, fibrinogen binding protein [Staphylococcus aureus]
MKKRIDYLSNKQNKYSIRRFTVGTTSVIVGATILFGIGNHQAQASEHRTIQRNLRKIMQVQIPKKTIR